MAEYRSNTNVKHRMAMLAREYRLVPENILKNKARKEVRKAIMSGKLKKCCCEICGASKTQAHHFDYTRPMDISWLCIKHHTLVHKKGLMSFWEVE